MSSDGTTELPLAEAYITPPAPCPYLPGKTEQRILLPLSDDNSKAVEQLNFFTRLGFRRTQNFLYRPNCRACNACVSWRIRVADFKPTVTQARIARRNKDLWWRCETNANLLALYSLFLRYQQTRHTDSDMAKFTYTDFLSLMEAPAETCGIYTLSRATQDHVGAILVDEVTDGLSAVYSFYEPTMRARSLGTSLIMRLVEDARQRGLPYVYLGYWVKDSLKMGYKSRFLPAEVLTENGWIGFNPNP